MLTAEAVAELRGRTGVSSLDAVRALSACGGKVEEAIAFLLTSRAQPRMLNVGGAHCAERLAESLVRSGLWFECEQLGRDDWRFAVAPAAYAELLSLHCALLADLKSGRSERSSRSAVAERTLALVPVKSSNGSTA